MCSVIRASKKMVMQAIQVRGTATERSTPKDGPVYTIPEYITSRTHISVGTFKVWREMCSQQPGPDWRERVAAVCAKNEGLTFLTRGAKNRIVRVTVYSPKRLISVSLRTYEKLKGIFGLSCLPIGKWYPVARYSVVGSPCPGQGDGGEGWVLVSEFGPILGVWENIMKHEYLAEDLDEFIDKGMDNMWGMYTFTAPGHRFPGQNTAHSVDKSIK